MKVETKLLVTTDDSLGVTVHGHTVRLPEGALSAGVSWETSEEDGHTHTVTLASDLAVGETAEVSTSSDGVGPHSHELAITPIPVEVDESEDGAGEVATGFPLPDRRAAPRWPVEVKQMGGHVVETKIGERNGVRIGFIDGYISTWDADTGLGSHSFGVSDRFMPGAFQESIQEHRDRDNRQVRFKDHHGRTVGGFPIDTVREDNIGLRGVGEINLEVQQGLEAFKLAQQGVLVDFSVGFSSVEDSIVDGSRVIAKAILWEGSIVDEPANQNARILEVKKLEVNEVKDMDRRSLERALLASGAFSKCAAKHIASYFPMEELEAEEEILDTAESSGYDGGHVLQALEEIKSLIRRA